MGKEGFAKVVEHRVRHLESCMHLLALQHEQGRLFLHERPKGVTSGKHEEVRWTIAKDGVKIITARLCAFGLPPQDHQGKAFIKNKHRA